MCIGLCVSGCGGQLEVYRVGGAGKCADVYFALRRHDFFMQRSSCISCVEPWGNEFVHFMR